MAENSSIQWCHHTFNPWSGCTKISDGCKNCYAADNYSVRVRGVKWGPQGNRIVAAESMWKQPLKWDRWAKEGVCYQCHGNGRLEMLEHCQVCKGKGKIEPYRARVFCASLADVFEDWTGPMMAGGKNEVYLSKDFRASSGPSDRLTMNDVRQRLFDVITSTENLDWLLLTKRPENIERFCRQLKGYALVHLWDEMECYPDNFHNLWLGTSVENQQTADERIPHLLRTPAAVRFLSCEPLLGPLEFSNASGRADYVEVLGRRALSGIDWVIVGGESGHNARPCRLDWIRSIVEQCKSGVACFVKQLGAHPIEIDMITTASTVRRQPMGLKLIDRKGGDISEFPSDLRIREFPKTGTTGS